MPITILSSGRGWHVRDLERAAATLGVETKVADFRRVAADVICGRPAGIFASPVIVRTMPPGSLEQVIFRMDVLHRLEAEGVRVINAARALEICIDKYLCSAILVAAGLAAPPTIVCQTADAAMVAFEQLGCDVIVKPLFGSEGRGMVRVSDRDLAWRAFIALERTQSVLYLQQFVDHPGWDLRVFVLNGRVLQAMRRRSNHSWRTNVAQGATAEFATPGPDECDLAIRAAVAVKAAVAGVDLLPAKNGGYYVLEVNAVPGWRALSRVTGFDVAREIVQFALTLPPNKH